MQQVLFVPAKNNQLSREQQSFLFTLNLHAIEIKIGEDGKRYCYYHINYNRESELKKLEVMMDKVNIKRDRVATITNLDTKYTAIYYCVIPKYIVHYITKGAGALMRTESKYVSALFDSGAIM